MSATVRDIVTDAQSVIGEVAGAGVQAYSDDRMKADAVRGFNMMFKKYRWHQYRKWQNATLDGVTGLVTAASDFSKILDFDDFISIHRDGERKPLPILPVTLNPSTLGISGTRVLYWTGLHSSDANYKKKKLQFYPITATGIVNIQAMVYPLDPFASNWDWTDVMYLDKDLLVYATAFMTLSGDDLSPGAASTVQTLMDMKFSDITKALASHPIPVSGGTDIPYYWQERPYGP
jgi:hypothetical protein